MNIYGWFLVILLTFVVLPLGIAWWMGCSEQIPLARLADPAPLPGELVSYGPFPVDTGPLLILSEKAAANDALSRSTRRAISETDWLIEEAERKIGPVQ